MILRRVEFTNFGPYNGRHVVDLGVSDGAPIILIHGENERGKTSFANTIRWCLYGRAKGRAGKILPTFSLMNWEALESRTYNMSVVLEFEHEGILYEMERHAQSDRRPTNDRELQIIPNLKKGNHLQATESIRDIIGGILHEDISRFFLFDGEMLNEYEDLLNASDNGSQLVRRSIEEILGLPALQRAAKDLEELRSKTERRQLQEIKARKENEKLTRDAEQKQDELTAIVQDIEQNTQIRARLESQRDQLREERAKFADIQADLRTLDQIEKDTKNLADEQDTEREKSRALIREAWWMPVEALISQQVASAQAQVLEGQATLVRRQEIQQQIDQLKAALHRGSCAVCGQQIGAPVKASLTSRLATAQAELDALRKSGGEISQPIEKLAQLRPFAAVGSLRVLAEKEARVRSLGIQIRRLDRRAEEIRERFRGHERAEIQRIEREYDLCISQIQSVGRVLDIVGARQRDARASLERLQQQIRSLPEANPKLAGEATLYAALKDLYEEGVAAFRERVRKDVESEATKIHQSLTTEPEYAGLRITDQYGLVLVNRAGRVIQTRSAGSEQVVALALIGALNRCATKEGPIVMDTPFGRLDVGHRRNILKFAPTFGKQVILLVQSGELDRSRDLEYLQGKVAREYQIIRDGASDRSKIIPLS
jgi:DNA sulfur modification protein DndD